MTSFIGSCTFQRGKLQVPAKQISPYGTTPRCPVLRNHLQKFPHPLPFKKLSDGLCPLTTSLSHRASAGSRFQKVGYMFISLFYYLLHIFLLTISPEKILNIIILTNSKHLRPCNIGFNMLVSFFVLIHIKIKTQLVI